MVASCKAKNSSSLKNFSIRPVTELPTGNHVVSSNSIQKINEKKTGNLKGKIDSKNQ